MSEVQEDQVGSNTCVDRVFVIAMRRVLRNWGIRLFFVTLETILLFIVLLYKYYSDERVTSAGTATLLLLLNISLFALFVIYLKMYMELRKLKVQLEIARVINHIGESDRMDTTIRVKLSQYEDLNGSFDYVNPGHRSWTKEAGIEVEGEIVGALERRPDTFNGVLSTITSIVDFAVFVMAIWMAFLILKQFPNNDFIDVVLFAAVGIAFLRVLWHFRWRIILVVLSIVCCTCCRRNVQQQGNQPLNRYEQKSKIYESAQVDRAIKCSFCHQNFVRGHEIVKVSCPIQHKYHNYCYDIVNRLKKSGCQCPPRDPAH